MYFQSIQDNCIVMALFLLMAIFIIITEARSQSSKRFRFQEMKHQLLPNDLNTIQRGQATDITACAMTCIKDEKCISLSYDSETHDFVHSSGYPVMADGIDENATRLPDVFMKVNETVTFEACGTFLRRELIIPNETALQTHLPIPFNMCAHHCPIDSNCFGFYYDPTEARCVLLLSDPTSLTEITDRQSNALFFLRSEEEGLISNVDRDKQCSQSSTFGSYYGSYAVNGVFYTDMASCDYEAHPFWMVDLEISFEIIEVTIFKHRNLEWNQPMLNPAVHVGMTTGSEGNLCLEMPLCDSRTGPVTEESMKYICPAPMSGRFVCITSYDRGYDHYQFFSEVEVYAYI